MSNELFKNREDGCDPSIHIKAKSIHELIINVRSEFKVHYDLGNVPAGCSF